MWDKRYSEAGFAYGTTANDFLREQVAHIKPGGKVLCLADGEGRNSVFLAELGFAVTAVDLSQVGLDKAQSLASERGVTITTIHADLAEFDLGEAQWDAVVSISAHMPKPIRQNLHQRVQQALTKKGVVILEAYCARQLTMPGVGGPPVAEMMMELEDLKQEFSQLQLLHAQELDREISEGKFHQGLSAVVQIIAQKA